MMEFWLSLALTAAPWGAMGASQRAEQMAAIQHLPTLRERVLRASELFLGTRYVNSPLGEGSGRDTDPLLRWDAVDCVTLVETSFALSLATPKTLEAQLTALRYRGSPSWAHRLHVMEAQWLPAYVEWGLLTPASARWAGASTVRLEKVITEQTWQQKAGQALELPPEDRPEGTFALEVIPAERALEVLRKAPPGLVVVVVRADRPSLVTRVTHVGILVQTPQGPALRHASRSYKKVVDEPLERYLSRNLHFASWTIEGLALFEPTLSRKNLPGHFE